MCVFAYITRDQDGRQAACLSNYAGGGRGGRDGEGPPHARFPSSACPLCPKLGSLAWGSPPPSLHLPCLAISPSDPARDSSVPEKHKLSLNLSVPKGLFYSKTFFRPSTLCRIPPLQRRNIRICPRLLSLRLTMYMSNALTLQPLFFFTSV